jgi:hypothetical protein
MTAEVHDRWDPREHSVEEGAGGNEFHDWDACGEPSDQEAGSCEAYTYPV